MQSLATTSSFNPSLEIRKALLDVALAVFRSFNPSLEILDYFLWPNVVVDGLLSILLLRFLSILGDTDAFDLYPDFQSFS